METVSIINAPFHFAARIFSFLSLIIVRSVACLSSWVTNPPLPESGIFISPGLRIPLLERLPRSISGINEGTSLAEIPSSVYHIGNWHVVRASLSPEHVRMCVLRLGNPGGKRNHNQFPTNTLGHRNRAIMHDPWWGFRHRLVRQEVKFMRSAGFSSTVKHEPAALLNHVVAQILRSELECRFSTRMIYRFRVTTVSMHNECHREAWVFLPDSKYAISKIGQISPCLERFTHFPRLQRTGNDFKAYVLDHLADRRLWSLPPSSTRIHRPAQSLGLFQRFRCNTTLLCATRDNLIDRLNTTITAHIDRVACVPSDVRLNTPYVGPALPGVVEPLLRLRHPRVHRQANGSRVPTRAGLFAYRDYAKIISAGAGRSQKLVIGQCIRDRCLALPPARALRQA